MNKEDIKEFFESMREYLKSINDKPKMLNQKIIIHFSPPGLDKGLTYEEKAKIQQLARYQKCIPPCRCYRLGDKCKLHGITYVDINPAVATER